MPDTMTATAQAEGLKISAEERDRRKAAADYARASSRLEGVILPPEHEAIWTRYINGEINAEERGRTVRALYGR